MSETDDTDTLLLIPPDFYVIDSSDSESKHYGPCFSVVNSLIDHVTRLEDKVNNLTGVSDGSKLGSSIDSHLNSFRMSHPLESNYPTSSQSTPQKPRGKYANSSLPSTPTTDRFSSPRKSRKAFQFNKSRSIESSPDKPNREKLLEEVDKFINNVKTIQKLSVPKNLNNEFSKGKINDLDMQDVDKMLQEMEIQQNDIETKLRQKEGEIFKSKKNDKDPIASQTKTWKPGENKGSVPDLNYGMRDLMYESSQESIPVVEEACVKNIVVDKVECSRPIHFESIGKDSELNDTSLSSSNDSTQITSYHNAAPPTSYVNSRFGSNRIIPPESEKIHSNAVQVLHMHKTSLQNKEDNSFRKDYSKNSIEDLFCANEREKSDIGLINLAELWGQKKESQLSDYGRGDSSKIMYKLEEERLRRQHCEQLINELQARVLEQQQKIAVAIEVDATKDGIIAKFREAWDKMSIKMQSLRRESNDYEQRCMQMQKRFAMEMAEANNKAVHFEKEASKALDLAHVNQEKFNKLDHEKLDLLKKIDSLQNIVTEIQLRFRAETERSGQLTEVLAQKEIEANKNKQVLADAQKEVLHSKRAIDLCQAELTAMKTEYDHLVLKLNDQKLVITKLEEDAKKSKENEQAAKYELDKIKINMESTKIELRNFYQDQVETVVKDKLQEFQSQLQIAEQNLKEELKKREQSIAHSAAHHMCQLSQQNKIEVRLLEEKHSEEIKLYELRLSQANQNIEKLVAKFRNQQEKRNMVASKLQKVMEAQWYEAMKIINSNGKSPTVGQEPNALEQLNSLKSSSFSNIQDMLMSNINDDVKNDGGYKTNAFVSQNSTSSANEEENYKSKRSNYKLSLPDETPVTTRGSSKNKQTIEGELQKYIQLEEVLCYLLQLLNKPPGQPLVEEASGRHHHQHQHREKHQQEAPTSDKYPPWQNPDYEDEHKQNYNENDKGFKVPIREQRPGKPPWKWD